MKERHARYLFLFSVAFLAYLTGVLTGAFELPPFRFVSASFRDVVDFRRYWRNDLGIEPTRHLTRGKKSRTVWNIVDPDRMSEGLRQICTVFHDRPIVRDRHIVQGMRAGIPIDLAFPRIELRAECSLGTVRAYSPNVRSYDAEVYNTQFFFDLCDITVGSRGCFEPIYGLHCLNTSSVNYGQPVAFFTSAFADRVASAAGAVAARSVVFGFPLVYFKPSQAKPAIERILFCEWQLPARIPIDCQ